MGESDTDRQLAAIKDVTAEALTRAVDGQFRLVREIGRGGMGVVYCAHDEQLHRDVALKTLPPHLAVDPEVRRRFLREARTAAGLSHPHIVPIYSAAERDGVVYFAMGFVDGESLAERVARGGPLSPRELVALLRQLADALGYAHARGVVHRDVKAENVLLEGVSGKAMITDFGIARVAESQPLTATGTVLGTVHYMSPEQVAGDVLDGRSDLYSLGVLAFFALSGRFPFERPTSSAVVVAHVNAPPPRLSEIVPEVPHVLEEMVARLLAKAPRDRYADGAALLDALNRMDDRALEAVNLSSVDAQAVWSRAAELQANTGMIIPPASFASGNDEAPLTRGFAASVVRSSALDAGIDARYVDRALAERSAMALASIEDGELMQKKPSWWLGSRTKLEYTTAFDGELHVDDFEEVADEVRRTLGEIVTVNAVGRTMTINTSMSVGRNAQGRAFQLHLTLRHGRTNVRVYEDLTNVATQWFAGLGIGAGSAIFALVGAAVGTTTHSPELVIAALVPAMGSVWATCRYFYRRTVRKRDAQIREILRRVVLRAKRVMQA